MPSDLPRRGAIEAAARGEAWAVDQILATIRECARLIHRSVPTEPVVDWQDLAQEAIQRFFASGLRLYRGTGAERSYLYTIVRTTWVDLVRSARRRAARHAASVTDPEDTSAGARAARDRVRRVLETLDAGCRQLLAAIFLEGRSYPELAAFLGLGESSIRSRVSRCVRRARELSSR